MNSRNNKMELLGSAPISKALLAMGIPAMLGMMVNAIYNLVDAYFVGGLGMERHLDSAIDKVTSLVNEQINILLNGLLKTKISKWSECSERHLTI